MTSKITSDYYYSSYTPPTTETGNSSLGKDAFLKLLITQLQNQDPTNPMDDREFIAQMAQFSSLEQMQNMTKAMESLLESQHQTQLMSYTSFIGKEVKWHELTEELDEKGNPVVNEGTGTVSELKFVDDSVVFVLADGKEISPGNISSIINSASSTSGTTTENPFVEASNLIGQTIQYSNSDGEMIQAIIEAITTKNGVIQYVLNNGERLTKDQIQLVEESTEDVPNAE